MTKEAHKESIKKATFLMVCSGESYFTEIVPGANLLDRMMAAMYDTKENWPAEELETYREELEDPDHWQLDQDYGLCQYSTDVGETDHIAIFRITNPLTA